MVRLAFPPIQIISEIPIVDLRASVEVDAFRGLPQKPFSATC